MKCIYEIRLASKKFNVIQKINLTVEISISSKLEQEKFLSNENVVLKNVLKMRKKIKKC